MKMNDNIRKIFDMLNIKPNEKFTIKDDIHIRYKTYSEGYYQISEALEVYYTSEDNQIGAIHNETHILPYLISYPETIIKLPKKKKLRDLTIDEYDKWCDANKCYCCYGSNNSKCIFTNVLCNPRLGDCWIYNKDLYSDKFLDQEIEVEE